MMLSSGMMNVQFNIIYKSLRAIYQNMQAEANWIGQDK